MSIFTRKYAEIMSPLRTSIITGLFLLGGAGNSLVQAQLTLNEVGLLPEGVQESSGLVYWSGALYTHNDSGGQPEIYELDPKTGRLRRTLSISGAVNTDWEDLAQDEEYLYIGDFGNNLGDRVDLRIYRVSKSDLALSDMPPAELIEFTLEDQTDFEPREIHPYDMEAFFSIGDFLVILTKDRENLTTTAYRLPSEPGVHQARRLDSAEVQGWVTGADFDPSTGRLFILGYNSLLRPFVAQADQVSEELIFSGAFARQSLDIGFAQAEGIAWAGADQVFVTTEFFGSNPFGDSLALLYSGEIDLLGESGPPVEDDPGSEDPPEEAENRLILYRPPGSDDLHFELNTAEGIFGRGLFSSSGVLLQYTPPEELEPGDTRIRIDHLPDGVYFLVYYLRSEILVKSFHAP